MRNTFRQWLFLWLSIFWFSYAAGAQAPTVEKVEPPNWWANMTINPVRVLLRGKNLNVGTVWTNSSALKASNIKASANGNYLFFNLTIAKNAKPGKYKISVGNKHSLTNFDFEIAPRTSRTGRFQGYTPDDVIYFLMPDRSADGDRSNNDPPKSKGLYDRSKPRHYHGGDFQGVIDKL